MSETLKYIPINDITTNPNQPRKQFNQDEIISLAESIEKNGLIQPIIVRSSDIIGYELIAGERRLRAHQYLGKNNIKAIVTETKTDDSLKQALIENIQRTDLNPIEEALAFQNIIEKLKITHEELAKIIGKSRPYISNQLRLLQLVYCICFCLFLGGLLFYSSMCLFLLQSHAVLNTITFTIV